ncbi:DNA helicase [Bombiscardovia apis]|uniref:DNA 3'-5' helicase n=1 Tax=Bombiscardovia apis TaxID=2932182 RepID=A0ABM8BBJ6_9BIFI|nr:UvrD-helicase domain-containing protein [Bombiscardovia apis]BDR54282.1 DNA helicase [Bombiscardovia apis]
MKFTPEQTAIIEAPVNDDLLVIAGAGSGKTMTMTNRIVSLIRRNIPPESILGLTFTNKAASELLSRVSAAVASQGQSDSDDSLRAFLKPEVRTYDAFFQSIVRQYGLLVGMDQATQPLSEAGAFQLAANVVQDHLDELFPRTAQSLEEALNGDSAIEDEGSDDDSLGAFTSTVNQLLALSRACSDAMISRECPTFDDAVERVRSWDAAFLAQLDSLLAGGQVPSKCPTVAAISKPKRAVKSRKETPAGKFAEFMNIRHDYRLYQVDKLRQVVRKRERLLTLAQYYQEAKRQAGMAEFSDFTLAAFQLVTRFPAIGASFRRRFTHVFLDEYQDTSTTQALLLAAIFHPESAGDEEGRREDPYDEPLATQAGPRRSAVTAVGDPYQSIYAWRGASPGAFKTFQREFGMDTNAQGLAAGTASFGSLPQDPLTLSQTFRNAHLVLDAANFLTEPLNAASELGKPSTSALLEEVSVKELSTREDADQGTLGLLGYQTLGQEVDGVVRFATEAKARYGQCDEAGFDKGAPHVAVLFRSKTSLPRYQEALEAAGLSVQVVGYSALFDRPEIMDLLALLRLTCDHTDHASLLRLLASPRFNMSAADLSALSNLAAQLNQESQYQALVEAGVVDEKLTGKDWSKAVRDYRDLVPGSIFLVDVLLRDDLSDLLKSRKAAGISPRGRFLLIKAGQVLVQAQEYVGAPLRQAVLGAARALGLDIDVVVSQAMRTTTGPIDASSAKASLAAFFGQVDAYVQELPEGVGASLAGFVAWIDAMRLSPSEPASGLDAHADVVLMTIHQAKGLEWDAVAVVGMKKGVFPSSQGDHLKIDPEQDWDEVSGSMPYESTAHTWLEDLTAVPVPVRADAQILPRFPHDADGQLAPEEAFASLTLEQMEDEALGQIRQESGFSKDDAVSLSEDDGQSLVFASDALPDYLSQRQEYGRRLHKDERRLAYVALTRARHDLLLTFSEQPGQLGPALLLREDEKKAAAHSKKAKGGKGEEQKQGESERERVLDQASNFWRELQTRLSAQSEVVRAGSAWQSQSGADQLEDGRQLFTPHGCFIGEHAQDYERAVVSQALGEADQLDVEGSAERTTLWPVGLSDQIGQVLAKSAEQVNRAERASNGKLHYDVHNPSQEDQQLDQPNSLYAHAERLLNMGSGRLGVQGDLLVRDTQALKQVGAQVIGQSAQSVTAIQARSGAMRESEERRYWRSVVRPVPQVSSPLAQAGTLFHAWAADFILPQLQADCGAVEEPASEGVDAAIANDVNVQGQDQAAAQALGVDQLAERERMLKELDQPQTQLPDENRIDRQLVLTWERRLALSPWAQRKPEWVERPIVAAVAGQIVKGKLDAVFAGGIEASDATKRFTIVDWKTGHRPVSVHDRELKLAQLDLYRLLLSRKENIPLESIDACLYYVSEDDASQRLIPATPRSEQDIEAQVVQGLPEQSDND